MTQTDCAARPRRCSSPGTKKGQVKIRTPFDPRTGQRDLFLDELELIRRLCAQIPAPRQHMVRYFGYYSNRSRGARGETATVAVPTVDDSPSERARRRSWARLLKRVFEVDPLLCPQCNVEMKFVAVIQDFSVVDRILAHLRSIGGNDPHEGTAQRALKGRSASGSRAEVMRPWPNGAAKGQITEKPVSEASPS